MSKDKLRRYLVLPQMFLQIWKDEEIHVYVMVEICDVPNCDIEDIVEVIPDEEEQANDER